MADQKKVRTSYDSGAKNTAKPASGGKQETETVKKEETLDSVLKKFRTARDYIKDNYQENWGRYWQCYQGIRTRRGYEGISDDFVPETFTIIESIKANIAGGRPKFNFIPMTEEQKQDTDILNHLMDFYWEQNRMPQKVLSWIGDMLVMGNGVLMVSWEGDMPRIHHIPLSDFFVDPTATHMNNPEEPGYPKYAGYRYLTNVESLKKKKLVNPETGEMEDLYTGLNDIEPIGKEWDELDKEEKEKFLGSTLGKDAHKEQIECIVLYTLEKKYVVANRNTLIYEGPNPYQREEKTEEVILIVDGEEVPTEKTIQEVKPFLPFCILRNYVDGSLFFAKGDVATIIDRQETLNDISNQKQDNITYALNNMWQIDPQFSHLAETIESLPGAVYPIPRGALAPIEKQIVTSEADNEMHRIKDEMRRATAADEVVQGASQDKGRITATEVQAQINQASQRFATKLNILESEGYAQLARILFKMVQIFVDEEMTIRIVGEDMVTQWADFDPNDFGGEYEPQVELESTTRMAKQEEAQKLVQLSQVAIGNPLVNQEEFMRMFFEKAFDIPKERVNTLIQAQEMAPPMGEEGGELPSDIPSEPLPMQGMM